MLASITCPNCGAAYRVPAQSIGAGRQVRCSKCRTEWMATADEAPAVAQEAFEQPAPLPEPETPAAETPAPILSLDEASGLDMFDRGDEAAPLTIDVASRRVAPRRGAMPRLGAVFRRPGPAAPKRGAAALRRPRPAAIVAAVGIAALGVLVGGRVEIVRAAPSLASLYKVVGMPVNVRGLAIHDVRSSEEFAEGAPMLVVTGVVENVSGVEIEVPRLRLAVTAKEDREVYAWTTVAARSKLAPGETASFRARLASPPAEGQAISVRFLARRDLMAAIDR